MARLVLGWGHAGAFPAAQPHRGDQDSTRQLRSFSLTLILTQRLEDINDEESHFAK